MKKLCSLILMLCAFTSPAVTAAETDDELGLSLELQTIRNNPTRITAAYEKSFGDSSFGLYAVVSKESDGYRQFYAGPKWRPVEWLEVGVGIGREVAPDELSTVRRNAFFAVDYEKVFVFGSFESGGSGRWHTLTAVYAVDERFSVGAMKETGLGFGLRLEYNIKKNVQLWGAILRSKDTGTISTLAIKFSF